MLQFCCICGGDDDDDDVNTPVVQVGPRFTWGYLHFRAPWNVLFIRVLFICKLYSGMEVAHLEIFI